MREEVIIKKKGKISEAGFQKKNNYIKSFPFNFTWKMKTKFFFKLNILKSKAAEK